MNGGSCLFFFSPCALEIYPRYATTFYQIYIDNNILLLAEDTFNADGILQFLDNSKFPLITVLTELNSAKVYSSTKKLQVAVAYI